MKRRHFLTIPAGAISGTAGRLTGSVKSQRSSIPSGLQVDPRNSAFWDLVRHQFPLTRQRIYLNTGGLGASPYTVIETVQQKMMELETLSETGHGESLWHDLKKQAAQFLGCQPEELAFTRNTTEGVNIVCNGLPLRRGDEVITTTHEHVGNTIAWLARQKRDGIVIKAFDPNVQSASDTLNRLNDMITSRTRVISISHITTSTGQIFPVEKIGRLAAERNIWYFVDGAQAPGMMPVNLSEIHCHAYATSGHKWLLGPKGTGILFVRKDMLETIQPMWVGAYSNEGPFDIRSGEFHFNPTAQRYEYGTINVSLYVGLVAALEFLSTVGMDNIWRHNHALADELIHSLENTGAEILSPKHPQEHSAMVTFRVPNMAYPKLQTFLARRFKLRTRGVYEGGVNGVRVSFHLYNSFEEVQQVVAGIKEALKV